MQKSLTIFLLIALIGIPSISISDPGDEIWIATWGPTWKSSPINEASGGVCDGYDYIYLIWDHEEPSSQEIDTWWLIGNQLYHQIDNTTAEVWTGSCEESHPDLYEDPDIQIMMAIDEGNFPAAAIANPEIVNKYLNKVRERHAELKNKSMAFARAENRDINLPQELQ